MSVGFTAAASALKHLTGETQADFYYEKVTGNVCLWDWNRLMLFNKNASLTQNKSYFLCFCSRSVWNIMKEEEEAFGREAASSNFSDKVTKLLSASRFLPSADQRGSQNEGKSLLLPEFVIITMTTVCCRFKLLQLPAATTGVAVLTRTEIWDWQSNLHKQTVSQKCMFLNLSDTKNKASFSLKDCVTGACWVFSHWLLSVQKAWSS